MISSLDTLGVIPILIFQSRERRRLGVFEVFIGVRVAQEDWLEHEKIEIGIPRYMQGFLGSQNQSEPQAKRLT